MKIIEMIKVIKTSPKAWKIAFQNKDSIVFAWDNYRSIRISDRFGSAMMLTNRLNRINID